MDSTRSDFLGQYKAISAKLKKRFLRKPNVAEASSKFGELAKQLEQNECPHYAAFSCLAVARCESTLGNVAEESQTLVKAARLFLEAEELNHQLMCPSFSENLNAALSCYEDAIAIYEDQNQAALAAALCLEAGKALQHLGRIHEALSYYQRAAKLQCRSPLDYVNSLELVAECKIKTGDYDCALDVLTEVYTIAEERSISNTEEKMGVFASILGRAEITRVLLLLLLQPAPQKLKQENAKLLEKYAWESSGGETPVNYISEDLFLLMQSFVMASQSHDIFSLKALEKDMWPFLTAEQNDLLHKIIEKLK